MVPGIITVALHCLRPYRSFATSVTTQILEFLSYWYRNKRLQMYF